MSAREEDNVRVDQWLWAVRVYKTRAIARDMCQSGKVRINEQRVKPSRNIGEGDIITAKKDGLERLLKVTKCVKKRVGAKIAVECLEDLTPEEEIKKHKAIKSMPVPRRARGAGRPTKKERRDLDSISFL
jgi:ribosome-associated heat shock protein Hsp15